MLLSTWRRAAQPVIVAVGHERTPGGLRIELLMIAEHITDRAYTLKPAPGASGESVRVRIPAEYLDSRKSRELRNVTLEVTR